MGFVDLPSLCLYIAAQLSEKPHSANHLTDGTCSEREGEADI